ncbi:hypothetical protein R3W88_032046 [Solanum pinnatisectum]|uniref:Uncharacterized protein n=1 Tax=Solanum pinnatisectum TaxID=50273 RepID=A0AAV9LRH7_9SOLN|nr:hypothetical protein R3W88_032046 [Solanum pinnatisectum]
MATDPKTPDSSSRVTVTNTPNITSHSGEVLVCINLHSLLIGYNLIGYINGSVQVSDDETNFQTRQDKLVLHAILASVSEAIDNMGNQRSHKPRVIYQFCEKPGHVAKKYYKAKDILLGTPILLSLLQQLNDG